MVKRFPNWILGRDAEGFRILTIASRVFQTVAAILVIQSLLDWQWILRFALAGHSLSYDATYSDLWPLQQATKYFEEFLLGRFALGVGLFTLGQALSVLLALETNTRNTAMLLDRRMSRPNEPNGTPKIEKRELTGDLRRH